MDSFRLATIETDGWTLESAEARHAKTPETFQIPERAARESLKAGDAAKLLFEFCSRTPSRVEEVATVLFEDIFSLRPGDVCHMLRSKPDYRSWAKRKVLRRSRVAVQHAHV